MPELILPPKLLTKVPNELETVTTVVDLKRKKNLSRKKRHCNIFVDSEAPKNVIFDNCFFILGSFYPPNF